MITVKTQLLRVIACCGTISATVVLSLKVLPPVLLAIPFLVGIGGFIAQRELRWGMSTATWVLVGLFPCSFVGTAWFCDAKPDQLVDVLAAPYAFQVAAILGVPWIIGSLIGGAWVSQNRKEGE